MTQDPRGNGDFADAVVVSPDGTRLFATGWSLTSGEDYTTVGYDAASGHVLWSRRYNGPGNGGQGEDVATAITVSPDGTRVFVTGQSEGQTSSLDYATVAYDAATGDQLWVSRYNGPPGNNADIATSIGMSPDGSMVFVTGRSRSAGYADYDYATVAYDAYTGATVWLTRDNGPAMGDEEANALKVSPDGSVVFVTGQGGAGGSVDYVTVAYTAANGSLLWSAHYDGPIHNRDNATALGVSPDGRYVFVTGESSGFGTDYDYATVAYDASTGMQLWASRFSGPGRYPDQPHSLAVSPDGTRIVVTGTVTTPGRSYYGTLAYDGATGDTLWTDRYTRGGLEDARSVAVSADGSEVFVTGVTGGFSSDFDFGTVAYDLGNGDELWARTYNDPSDRDDDATAVAVGPDPSLVFVTGYGTDSQLSEAFTTVAYSA